MQHVLFIKVLDAGLLPPLMTIKHKTVHCLHILL